MKIYWFTGEIVAIPFWMLTLSICALVASAVLWA